MGERPIGAVACPECGEALDRRKTSFACASCDGVLVPIDELRRRAPLKAVDDFTRRAVTGAERLACPRCAQRMRDTSIEVKGDELAVSFCTRCRASWCRASELARLPPPPALDPRDVARAARFEAQGWAKQTDAIGDAVPDSPWKWIIALLGMPVEHSGERPLARPVVTWSIAALCTAAFVWQYFVPELIRSFGLIPAEVGRWGGLTLITSFFLHGSIDHLLGNMWFLLVFARLVEEALGRAGFIALVLGGTACGGLMHCAFEPDSTIPAIGASDGISAVMVFYALAFPRQRIGFVVRLLMVPRYFHIGVGVALSIWILLLAWGLLMQRVGWSNVSAAAHVGGAVAGVVGWWVFRGVLHGTLRGRAGGREGQAGPSDA